jgi:hypothetical protein
LSFFPDYCHSFRISVIPSKYCHSFQILSFLPNIVIPSEIIQSIEILTSSKSFPYPKGEKNGHRRWPYMLVNVKTFIYTITVASKDAKKNSLKRPQKKVIFLMAFDFFSKFFYVFHYD